jgi:hypothetical protein
MTPFVSPRIVPSIVTNGIPEQPVFLGAAVGQDAGVMQVNLFVPNPGGATNNGVHIGPTFFRIWTIPQP